MSINREIWPRVSPWSKGPHSRRPPLFFRIKESDVSVVKSVFWLSFLVVLYTYIGYPLILSAWRFLGKKRVRKGAVLPSVSVIVAVYNEEGNIERKLKNLFDLDYPASLLEIIISSDGSTDQTEARVTRWQERHPNGPSLLLLTAPTHVGKAAALNRAVAHARGELLVFTDARQRLDRRAVALLATNFADDQVGAVSGELILMERPEGEGAAGVGLYWRYEKWLRKMESDVDSTLGATGAIYAVRKSLYEPIPAETILDDVLIPMQVVFRGYRTVFEPKARAYDFIAKGAGSEFVRKVRTLSGNYQLLWEVGPLWSWKKNRVFFQYFSHKVARLAVPFMLMLLMLSNLFLMQGVYFVFFWLQVAWYGLAILGGMSYGKVYPKTTPSAVSGAEAERGPAR
ncbi:MAG: glycosyltransferase family 2 protein [Candidatus Manganitrophaceae bacterium]|nr:MAG: glycosyltransferase family 2 protein [Candidatus Manganitrophaceae bacterium]